MNLRLDPTPAGSAVSALQSLLRARGLDVDNFEIEEHESSGLSDLLGGSERILAVKCRSTGEERLYAAGADSAWLGAFVMDLGSGHFGRLVRALP